MSAERSQTIIGQIIAADLSGQPIACPPVPRLICDLPKVTVDGSPVDYAVGIVGAAPDEPMDATEVQRQAIASAVKSAVMARGARKQGLAVSDAEVQVEIQRQLALVSDSTAQGKPPAAWLFGGLTPQAYWSSAKAVEHERTLLLLGKEQFRIVSKPLDEPQRAKTMADWLRTVLANYRVLINGQPPSFSLPDELISRANKPPPVPFR